MQPKTKTLFSREDIAKTVARLGAEITRDFAGQTPVFISILKGSFIFLADLVREVNLPLHVDFMEVSSYEGGTTSTGNVKILKDIKYSIAGKPVILVEDIIDTGLTLNFVIEHLKLKQAESVYVVGLLVKSDKHKFKYPINYMGFSIPDHFVIGYGMDYNGLNRNMDHIGILEET